jgi:tRNA-(MS[2]IO[6]A)-hydroxylase (MiaE)-like
MRRVRRRCRCYAAAVTESQPPGEPPGTAGPAAGDGVIDLLGLLAYAELDAFFRLAEDAALAPSLADKAALGGMAVAEFSHFERIRDELQRLGADPGQAMHPFTGPLDDFHVRTAPSDWLESLVKAYVGDGIAADFYRAVAEVLEPGPRALVLEVLADTGHAQFAVEHLRAAIAADPKVAGRLALWARRLVGEALGQAQRVAAQRPALAYLLVPAPRPAVAAEPAEGAGPVGGAGPAEGAGAAVSAGSAAEVSQLGEIGRMFARLTDAHAQRMSVLGLSA